MEKLKTVEVNTLVEVMVNQYGYIINEKNEDGYIMENKTLPELGKHSVLFHCDYSSGEVTPIIGQLPDELNKKEKHNKIQELIFNACNL